MRVANKKVAKQKLLSNEVSELEGDITHNNSNNNIRFLFNAD